MKAQEAELHNRQGFTLIEERPTQGISFRDGFHLRYARHPVDLVVDYRAFPVAVAELGR